jgi:hypothetical protein
LPVIRLAALFCAPFWRSIAIAAEAAPSSSYRARLLGEASHRIGIRTPRHTEIGHPLNIWITHMVTAPMSEPSKTFPETRRRTADGNPTKIIDNDAQRTRRATREFAKNRHVPPWLLPSNHKRKPPDLEPDTTQDLLTPGPRSPTS